MHFDNLHDLARLPWFEVREDRLVTADPDVGPIVDIHAHLALSFHALHRPRHRLDPGPTKHFLPTDHALDLDIYVNQNLGPEELAAMEADLVPWSTSKTFWPTHTVPNLLKEMGELGIVRSILLAIDLPTSRNAHRYLRATSDVDELTVFGSVHPFHPWPARALDQQIKLGARGIKQHPGVQLVAPSHPRAQALHRLCGERGLPVFFHCGPVGIAKAASERLTQVAGDAQPHANHPETTFVLGHSGALQVEEAIALSREHDNVWLDLACQSLTGHRRILAECDPDKILYGTDWPFYHQAIGIAKVLLATEDASIRRRVLHDNAVRLLEN